MVEWVEELNAIGRLVINAKDREAFVSFCQSATVEELVETSLDKYRFAVGKEGDPAVFSSCALCVRFYFGNSCENCPVYVYSGQRFCGVVPFDELEMAIHFGETILEWVRSGEYSKAVYQW